MTQQRENSRPGKWTVPVVWAVRIFFGAVFLVSGFAKGIDPSGTVYKLTDYFAAFGLEAYLFAPYFWAFLLALVEFLLGMNTLFGSYRRRTAWLDLLFMAVMTPFTLYLALRNPVTDCGCFGDLVLLSNWETFFKNLLLLGAAVVLFRYNRFVSPLYNQSVQWLTVGFGMLYIAVVGWVGSRYEPLLDFRPYTFGTDLAAAVSGAADEGERYDTELIYEKDGERRRFKLSDYPANDSTWRFVETVHTLQDAGSSHPASDFFVTDASGTDVTESLLSHPGYTLLLLSPDLSRADDNEVDKINELYDYSKENGYPFYCLTSSLPRTIAEWQDNAGAEYPFLFADGTLLKTIARSNPAVLLLKDGVIAWKGNPAFLPDEERLDAPLESLPLGTVQVYASGNRMLWLGLFFAAPLLLLLLTEKALALVVSRIRNRRVKRVIETLSQAAHDRDPENPTI